MPRQPRLDLAHVPQHVVQRGNDRQPCFFGDNDRACYLSELRDIVRDEGCMVHAFVLMSNHVHLLFTPSAVGQVASVMQGLGRRYVRYFNDRHHRTGTLWEGRYKSCLIDTDSYLLRCMRYIERNPVRASMVASAEEYPWSSYAGNALGVTNPLVQPHPAYLALGVDVSARQQAYRSLVAEVPLPDEVQTIRMNLQRQHAWGSERFLREIEARLARRVGPAQMGRPRKPGGCRESAL